MASSSNCFSRISGRFLSKTCNFTNPKLKKNCPFKKQRACDRVQIRWIRGFPEEQANTTAFLLSIFIGNTYK